MNQKYYNINRYDRVIFHNFGIVCYFFQFLQKKNISPGVSALLACPTIVDVDDAIVSFPAVVVMIILKQQTN